MSDSHETKSAVQSQVHDDHPVDFNRYVRTCIFVFITALCAIALMVWISYLPSHYSWAMKSTLILLVAAVNAFVLAGFLMHLLSEKKMIYMVLSFTVMFVLGLFWLTWYAMSD